MTTPKWMPPIPDYIPDGIVSHDSLIAYMSEYAFAAVEAYKRSLKPVVRAEVGDEWQDLVQLGPMKDGELFYRLDGGDDDAA